MSEITPAAAAAREAARSQTGQFGTQDRTAPAIEPVQERIMSEEEFDEKFGPLLEVNGSTSLTWDDVKDYPADRIWTDVDGDGCAGLSPGVHMVNQNFFVATQKPWTDDDVFVPSVWYCPDCGGTMFEKDDPDHECDEEYSE